MVTVVTLIVLRCRDVAASKRFYEALGFAFSPERHGAGPDHWSCRIGATVLELYPAGASGPSVGRLGFGVVDVPAAVRATLAAGGHLDREYDADRDVAVVADPDGTKIELSGCGAETAATSRASWSVWRQDDNGQRFRISGGHSRTNAERVCVEIEAKGHKQLYWVSPDDEAASAESRA
jgi:catechol 2,3-dioxygenase-like lactoylglutathione lyase family enzyme